MTPKGAIRMAAEQKRDPWPEILRAYREAKEREKTDPEFKREVEEGLIVLEERYGHMSVMPLEEGN